MTAQDDNNDKNNQLQNLQNDSDLGQRLAQLDQKIKRARDKNTPEAGPHPKNKAYSYAFKITSELIAGPLVGGFIGWWLDGLLATKPLFLLTLFILGLTAGFMNVMRTAKKMNETKKKPDK
ncbi:MAG: AtpZ/AtpI family protein [Pseudomonadota bacterium]